MVEANEGSAGIDSVSACVSATRVKAASLLALLIACASACSCGDGETGTPEGGRAGSPSVAGTSTGGGASGGGSQGGGTSAGATNGGSQSGGSNGAGMMTGGTSNGGMPAAGGAGGAGSGAGGSAGSNATGGTGGRAGNGGNGCTPNANASYLTTGEVVFDQSRCLHWMKESVSGMGLAAAKAYCEGLSRGGFEDWRVPIASEVATLITQCGMYPPMDTSVFTLSGDGIWTTTESGTLAGSENKVCGIGQNTGQYYDFGPVGAQHTRCVRGMGTYPMVKDCKTAQGCTNW